MNTPNKLTLFRIFLVPFFLAVYFLNLKHRMIFSMIVFAAASITDALDGHLARKNNLITDFGKLIDPIADKMLVTAGLLAFLKDGLCNVWIVFIILTRELAVTAVRLLASTKGAVIPANIGGKIKTVMQMVSFIAVMLLGELNYAFGVDMPLALISNILLGLTAAAAVASGVKYILDSRNYIDSEK